MINVKNDREKEWKENKSIEKGVLLLIRADKPLFIRAVFGTGDNLLREDIEAGYNDYIYIESYSFDGDEFVEDDGGQFLFNNEKADYYDNLEHFCKTAVEEICIEGTEYEILQMIQLTATQGFRKKIGKNIPVFF